MLHVRPLDDVRVPQPRPGRDVGRRRGGRQTEIDAAGVERLEQLLHPVLVRHLIDVEERIDQLFASLNTDALRFQEAYYAERRYLNQLDDGRRAGYEETLTAPAA
jgi:hypothetical protein